MDEYTEVYFLDDEDPRNAPRAQSGDHRSQNRPTRVVTSPVPRSRVRPMVIARPAVVQPVAAPSATDRLFANVSIGQLVELGTMVLAAIMPLPAAPIAQGVATTDLTNQIAYTSALALHAKRDEQLRTVGALVGKLVG